MLIQKSKELKIRLNTKNDYGQTAFHLTCIIGHSKIAETLIQKSADFKIQPRRGVKHIGSGVKKLWWELVSGNSRISESLSLLLLLCEGCRFSCFRIELFQDSDCLPMLALRTFEEECVLETAISQCQVALKHTLKHVFNSYSAQVY